MAATACMTGCVSVLSLFVSLWDTCSALLLVKLAKRKVAAHSVCAETMAPPSTGVSRSSWAGVVLVLELLEDSGPLFAPLHT